MFYIKLTPVFFSGEEKVKFPFIEPVTLSNDKEGGDREKEEQFSFAAPDIIVEEEAGCDTDEEEFLTGEELEEA